MDDWVEKLTADDMPTDDTRLIADSLGVEATLILMNRLAGMEITIPINGLNKLRNKYICDTYDGTKKSRLILAHECRVAEDYIRRLISKNRIKGIFNMCIPAAFIFPMLNDFINIFSEFQSCLL